MLENITIFEIFVFICKVAAALVLFWLAYEILLMSCLLLYHGSAAAWRAAKPHRYGLLASIVVGTITGRYLWIGSDGDLPMALGIAALAAGLTFAVCVAIHDFKSGLLEELRKP